MTEFEKKLSKLTAEQSRALAEHLNSTYNKSSVDENEQKNDKDTKNEGNDRE